MSQRFLNPLELNLKRNVGKVMVIKFSVNYNSNKIFSYLNEWKVGALIA
jgi:hypothetical protein